MFSSFSILNIHASSNYQLSIANKVANIGNSIAQKIDSTEQAPEEVLSTDGKGVDLYKMTSLVWAGMKAQQSDIDELKLFLPKYY